MSKRVYVERPEPTTQPPFGFAAPEQLGPVKEKKSLPANHLAGRVRKATENRGDLYHTPPWATRELLNREDFDGLVWEPCSGAGWMAKQIKAYGIETVASDIRVDDDVYGHKGWDFISKAYDHIHGFASFDHIITNPPYSLAPKMIEAALNNVGSGKVAMLLRTNFLESQSRYKLFTEFPPNTVYVFSRRVQPRLDGYEGKDNGTIAFCWIVWDGKRCQPTQLQWIEGAEFKRGAWEIVGRPE